MFTHLHLHTEYSLLDATIRINELIPKLQESGMNSCAMTDHGNMYGIFKFQDYMKAAGLKPIIGCEIYIAPRSMEEKEFGIDNNYFHLVLLAKNFEGYKNLMKIVSISHMEGFYYKPRIDFETLSKYSNGLIALSACLAGPLARPIMQNNYKLAKENAVKYAKVFKENFYVEVQRNGMEEQNTTNEGLIKIARELNLPLVATCDAHYLNKEDALIQEILWCISDGYTFDDPKRRKMPTNEFYVKTPKEMEELFKDLPEAIENTQKISDQIEEYDITFGRVEPVFEDIPKGVSTKDFLREKTYEMAKTRYPKITKEVRERVDYELGLIDEKGYNNYFLVVADFVDFCVKNNIMVRARGSGVGSVVAYCLRIANIDPLSWGLYFERFLNPGRNSPPDFDLDISDTRRMEVIRYAQEKYGKENVRQIVTFSKLQTRQAIRDTSRVMGIDLSIADKLSKLVRVEFGKTKSIDYMMESNPEFVEIVNSNEKFREMTEIVKKMAGMVRGVSIHACGVVITPKPVDEYVPIQPDSKGEEIGMVQYEMTDLEPLGLMKYDFLGLKNFSIIDNALRKIKRSTGKELDLYKIDVFDQEVYQDIKDGHTVGIFQLEGSGMIKTIRQVLPESPEELCYLIAAYRPGPMLFISDYVAVKKGEREAEYLLPELKPILEATNGIISYQEQVMRIATDIAGYTLTEADNMRRAMGKKKMEIMTEEVEKFVQGGLKKGFEEKKLKVIGDLLLKFANYGFNKSHSATYAMVSYYTAYLKHYYPLEYIASLLESDLGAFDDVIKDTRECERLDIKVLPPSINESLYYFSTEGTSGIRFGLGGIKNVGDDLVKMVVKEREKNGKYLHLDDFVHRTFECVGRKAMEYLVMAGAMDSFGNRISLMEILPEIYDKEKSRRKTADMGQIDIFSLGGTEMKGSTIDYTPVPVKEKVETAQILQWEKELLGIYFSSHPLDNLTEFFESKNVTPLINVLEDKKNNNVVILGVMVSKIRKITTKKGEVMAFLSIEDKTASTDAIIFPRVYQELKDTLQENKPILIAGRLNIRDGEKSVVVEKAKYVDETKHTSKFEGVTFKITSSHSEEEIAELKSFIENSNGSSPVRVIVDDGKDMKKVLLNKKVLRDEECEKWLRRFPA
ncbi:MAG: DNA polymerase III subunit alpha [Candidatus Dojkabacteria bacterium]